MQYKALPILFLTALATPVGELLVNGGFDAVNSCPSDGWCNFGQSSISNIAPWTMITGDNFEIDRTPWSPDSAPYSMDLNSDTRGGFSDVLVTIGQTIATVPDKVYTLSFALKGNKCNGQVPIKTGQVKIYKNLVSNGNLHFTENFSHNINQNSNNWQYVSFSFIAQSSATVITIGSTTPGTTCGPVIDSVSVVRTPNQCKV
ncbi:hypothetical protein BC833DRAFT_576310 [Globomyces pollinis-pini]|nr:hypothetical protein BC833DRAFT_576310 [Globomyces pollinis-pini]